MHEVLLKVIFYLFAMFTVIAAFFAVVQRNPVRGVLCLVGAFLSAAVLWMLAQAEFLALILVLVYVGAVMTLFLFVVMMLNIDTESMKSSFKRYLLWGLLGITVFIGLLTHALPKPGFNLGEAATLAKTVSTHANTKALGMLLYVDDVLAFEMAAVILLVAIIAAITLTHRAPRAGLRQNVLKQLMTKRERRITLISMPVEEIGHAPETGEKNT